MEKQCLLLFCSLLIIWQASAQTGTTSDSGNAAIIKISKENHVHKMSMNNKACISVKDGARIVFECWDALEGRSKEFLENKTPPSQRLLFANPATGPVFIEGAEVGDVLEVEIHDIRLAQSGFMNLHKSRFVDCDPDDIDYLEPKIVGQQLLLNNQLMPVHSNVGTIGTAGPEGLYTQEVADNGGNIDTHIIKRDSKVLLPVFTEGALLAMGDVHAAMGDGEVNGMGVEIGAEIEVTVRLRKDLKNKRPIVIYDNRVACIASNPDVLKAINQVLKDIGKYLVDVCGYNKKDASTLIAFYGNLRFCQVVNPQKTVRIEIDKQYMNLFKHKSLPF